MTAIAKTEFLNRLFTLMESDNLALPTLPEITTAIRSLLQEENSSQEELCHLINQDAAITAMLIQVANSALFRRGAPINSVDSAVMRLGRNVVETIVTGIAMEKLFFATSEVTNRKLKSAWQHAMEVSPLVGSFSRNFPHLKTEQAMLAGLIHDIGILPILTLAEEYPDLLENEAALDELIAEAHAKVGTAILEKWEFPAHIIEAVAHHEDLAYVSGAKATYADLVIVANLVTEKSTEELRQLDVANIPAFRQVGLEHVAEAHPGLFPEEPAGESTHAA